MKAPALAKLAAEHFDIQLTVANARKLIDRHGSDQAEVLVEGAGALVVLASALGRDLDFVSAMVRMLHSYFDYDAARDRLLDEVRRRKSSVFHREWERLEREFFHNDAWARHAVFVSRIMDKSLGWQAATILVAAGDAGLDADRLKFKLHEIVGVEIHRRYPVRREADWQVVDPDSRHHQLLTKAMRDERQAQQLALAKKPELAQRIDALSRPRLNNDIRRVLAGVRRQLRGRVAEGWIPDPERYEREVIDVAAAAARQAA